MESQNVKFSPEAVCCCDKDKNNGLCSIHDLPRITHTWVTKWNAFCVKLPFDLSCKLEEYETNLHYQTFKQATYESSKESFIKQTDEIVELFKGGKCGKVEPVVVHQNCFGELRIKSGLCALCAYNRVHGVQSLIEVPMLPHDSLLCSCESMNPLVDNACTVVLMM